jgi:hypothetical protein
MAIGLDAQEDVRGLAAVGDEHRFVQRDSLGPAHVLIELSAAKSLQNRPRTGCLRTYFCIQTMRLLLPRVVLATDFAEKEICGTAGNSGLSPRSNVVAASVD